MINVEQTLQYLHFSLNPKRTTSPAFSVTDVMAAMQKVVVSTKHPVWHLWKREENFALQGQW